ncbi:MAG: TVP38/TMEM64 family protein [Acetanaerobacterium sp.]
MTQRQTMLKIAYNVISAAGILFCAGLCIYFYRTGILTNQDAMSAFLLARAGYAALVFILIQLIQVVIPVIPGGISLAVGVWVFGPWYGFLYNYIGICLGSVLNFLVARHFGKPLVQAIVSPRIYNKYIGWLDKGRRFDTLFAWAIFLPVAPDDFLCMLAGLTSIPLKKYVAIILLCKPASIFLYSIGLSKLIKYFITLLPA